jgi:hypothetical protein
MTAQRHSLLAIALAAAVLLAACTGDAPEAASPPAEVSPTVTSEPLRLGTPIPLDPTAPLTTIQVRSWADRLIGLDSSKLGPFFEVARGTRDERLIVPLIEAMRFYEPDARLFFTDTLGVITGVDYRGDDTWPLWYQWLAEHPDLPLIDGYETWKADLYRTAAGGSPFERFLIDGRNTELRVELIQFGGAAIEGFPTLDPPRLIRGATAAYLEPAEPVIGVAIDGEARAYPLRIVDWHETVNDTVGGVPITVAYCTFCGSAAVWDRRIEDGTSPLTFGYSGLIYEATRLMHDNETDHLWSPLTGVAVHGPLAGKVALQQLPSIQTTWSAWLAAQPDTWVLDINTGFEREYTFDTRPTRYRASPEVELPFSQASDLLPPKEQVYSLEIDGTRATYRLSELREAGVVNTTIEGTAIVLVADGPAGGVRAYASGDHTFTAGPDGTLIDQSGEGWHVSDEGLLSPSGALQPRLVGLQAYWFAHFVFFPDAELRVFPAP